jgi:D-3-phosphoglycerate dehydrogenase
MHHPTAESAGDGRSIAATSENERAARGPVVALLGGAADWLAEAVRAGGGTIGSIDEADAAIYRGPATSFPPLPDSVRWVQFTGAGIEPYLAAGVIDDKRIWTSAAGAYADQVAEHAVALLLAGVRGLVTASDQRDWQPATVGAHVIGVGGSTVAVVGAGGIGRRIIELLAPYRVRIVAVTRRGHPVPGADLAVPAAEIDRIWDDVDHVIVAAPATAVTHHLIDASVLARLKPTSWVVNIARGSLIDTDALIEAIHAGRVAGAGLDVTDPEPLPADHPLWTTPGVLITPHVANPPHLSRQDFARRVQQNVARFAAGDDLLGVIDTAAGY